MSKKFDINLCHKIAGEKGFECLETEYINSSSSMNWKCKKCGYTKNTPFCVIKRDSCRCSKCTGHLMGNIEECQSYAINKEGLCLNDKYINNRIPMHWQCKCGNDWWANWDNIKRGHWCPKCAKSKAMETCFKKYGWYNILQANNYILKGTKTCNKLYTIIDKQNNKIYTCQGLYEYYTVKSLVERNIKFEWQIPFWMPNKKKYTVDLYFPNEDKYVEIKGYFWKDAQEKWEWFHIEHPNSELWMKDQLVKYGFLDKNYRRNKPNLLKEEICIGGN